MGNPILDPAALARLQRIGGDGLVAAMLDSFEQNARTRVEAAHAAAASGDAQALSDAAHALKSSAGNVGASSLQLDAQRVERESLEAGADLAALARTLEEGLARAREAIAAARRAS